MIALHPSPRRRSVLVYDDCPDNAESLAQLLALQGHRVRTAVQPDEAVAAAASDPPDVFITEVGPAHSTRFGLAGRVTRVCPTHPLMIAVTGWPLSWCDSEDVAFDHRFLKGDDPNSLLAVMNDSHAPKESCPLAMTRC